LLCQLKEPINHQKRKEPENLAFEAAWPLPKEGWFLKKEKTKEEKN